MTRRPTPSHGDSSDLSERASGGVGIPHMRHELCACGEYISTIDFPEFIPLAVSAHNEHKAHQHWRVDNGFI